MQSVISFYQVFYGSYIMRNKSLIYSYDKVAFGEATAGVDEIKLHICYVAFIFTLGYINLTADKFASAEAAFARVASCGYLNACTLKCTKPVSLLLALIVVSSPRLITLMLYSVGLLSAFLPDEKTSKRMYLRSNSSLGSSVSRNLYNPPGPQTKMLYLPSGAYFLMISAPTKPFS